MINPAPAAHSASDALEPGRERISAIDQAATQYLQEQRPENTTRSYAGDWTVWCQYCNPGGRVVT